VCVCACVWRGAECECRTPSLMHPHITARGPHHAMQRRCVTHPSPSSATFMPSFPSPSFRIDTVRAPAGRRRGAAFAAGVAAAPAPNDAGVAAMPPPWPGNTPPPMTWPLAAMGVTGVPGTNPEPPTPAWPGPPYTLPRPTVCGGAGPRTGVPIGVPIRVPARPRLPRRSWIPGGSGGAAADSLAHLEEVCARVCVCVGVCVWWWWYCVCVYVLGGGGGGGQGKNPL
jgi:hypothetical protein